MDCDVLAAVTTVPAVMAAERMRWDRAVSAARRRDSGTWFGQQNPKRVLYRCHLTERQSHRLEMGLRPRAREQHLLKLPEAGTGYAAEQDIATPDRARRPAFARASAEPMESFLALRCFMAWCSEP